MVKKGLLFQKNYQWLKGIQNGPKMAHSGLSSIQINLKSILVPTQKVPTVVQKCSLSQKKTVTVVHEVSLVVQKMSIRVTVIGKSLLYGDSAQKSVQNYQKWFIKCPQSKIRCSSSSMAISPPYFSHCSNRMTLLFACFSCFCLTMTPKQHKKHEIIVLLFNLQGIWVTRGRQCLKISSSKYSSIFFEQIDFNSIFVEQHKTFFLL